MFSRHARTRTTITASFSHAAYRELRDDGTDVFADVAAMEFAVAGIGRDHEMRRSFAFLQRNRCGFAATIAIFPKKAFSGASS